MDTKQHLDPTPHTPQAIQYKRQYVRRTPIIQLTPQLRGLGPLAEEGRNLDLLGIARALAAACADRLIRELDDSPDPARRQSLSDTGRYWAEVAIKLQAQASSAARPIEARAVIEGDPEPGEAVVGFKLTDYRKAKRDPA